MAGGTIAMKRDGRFTQTVAFLTEDAAREGERTEMPEEMRQEYQDEMAQVQVERYLDLHHPWFASKT